MKLKFANALSLALIVAMLFTSVALADDVVYDVNATVNFTSLIAGGATTQVDLYIVPQGADGKSGCNLTGSTILKVDVLSSNASVATVSPSEITFTNCEGVGVNLSTAVTVTPLSAGSATISLALDTNTTAGSFNLAPATFTAIVASSNTTPSISVNDVTVEGDTTGGWILTFSSIGSASDTENGIPSVSCTPALGSVLPLGSNTVSCTATDSGWLTASDSGTITVVDTTDPTVGDNSDLVLEATSPDGAEATFNNPSASDIVDSSVDVGCVPPSGIIFPLGSTTVTCTGTDDSSNSAQSDFTVLVQDTIAPSFNCTAPDNAVWYGSDVTVNCTASDGGSGLANPADASFSLTTSVLSGTETATASTDSRTINDVAGNSVVASPFTFKVDKKAPSFSCGGADGLWHAADVTIACSATDGGSGLVTPATFDLITNVAVGTEDANASTDSAAVTDSVGNSTTAGPIAGNKVDKKVPFNISFVGGGIVDGGSYYFGFVPAGPIDCTADDGGSGLASCAVTGGGTTVGSYSYVATATDNVGNSDTASLSYTVLAWTTNGFFQPVDMGSVWNTVKNGSTVPLKFELFAGSNELTDTGSVKSITSALVACTAGSEDAIETVVTATGGTTLRYDATAGQFIFNWKTPATANKCYRVTMEAQDGSKIIAFFKLK